MLRTELKLALSKMLAEKFATERMSNFSVEIPENSEYGDYATNVALVLAKILNKKPMEVAEEIVSQLTTYNLQLTTKMAPPGFINFFVSEKHLDKLVKEILRKKEKFGRGSKKKETIVVEYSSPNIAKPLGIHHLRTTVIGQALVNILRFSGYKVVSLSFPGDWGTQFGLLIAAYKKWGNPEKMKESPMQEMLELYVRISSAAKEDANLLEEGRAEFKKLEKGDKENLGFWRFFRGESLKDFERVYEMLGVKIEHTIGESYYEKELKRLIQDALDRGVANKGEDGSVVIALPDSPTPEIIQKSDGATIYTTRELAAIRHRLKKWKANKILYVAANQQTFHLEQVFKSAVALGYAARDQLGHVKFGMVLASGGKKFATREGSLVPMEDVLKEAIRRAQKVVEQLNPDLSPEEKDKIAWVVGVGAVKFFDLSRNRMSDMVFDWDKMLNLKGASAPYIQYSYARMKSILCKAGEIKLKPSVAELQKKEEISILRWLLHFPEVAEDAALRYEPNRLAEYLLRLAEKINHFYEKVPVLNSENILQESRLALLSASAIILKTGCELLGIDVPEQI